MSTTADGLLDEARDALLASDHWLTSCDLTGWDPYDGLSLSVARVAKSRRPRQVLVQGVKRMGPGGRRLLGVPQHRMTKTLALVSSGLTKAPFLQEAPARRQRLTRELLARRGAAAWGYEFDVQTRWGYYPSGSPNVIVTAFVLEVVAQDLGHAEREALIEWLEGEMWAGTYFRYVPGNDTLVHNANVLAARALHRLQPGHPYVIRAVEETARALPEGGLWPYGEDPSLAWVDNFHTAYVLDALLDLRSVSSAAESSLKAAIPTYEAQCFASDSKPYYYAGGGGPMDVHNIATALGLVARLREEDASDGRHLDGTLRFALHLRRADGSFRAPGNAPAFPRWNDGHMFNALAQVIG